MESAKRNRKWFFILNVVVTISFVALMASPLVSSSKNGAQSIGSFILFWCPLLVFWLIGLVMKKGLLPSFLWALLWFFGTGLLVFIIGMLTQGGMH